jgi:hypothetical protein
LHSPFKRSRFAQYLAWYPLRMGGVVGLGAVSFKSCIGRQVTPQVCRACKGLRILVLEDPGPGKGVLDGSLSPAVGCRSCLQSPWLGHNAVLGWDLDCKALGLARLCCSYSVLFYSGCPPTHLVNFWLEPHPVVAAHPLQIVMKRLRMPQHADADVRLRTPAVLLQEVREHLVTNHAV